MTQNPENVHSLLRSLREGFYMERKRAAEALGSLTETSDEIVNALKHAIENESDVGVRRAAIFALRSPAHKEYLKQHSELASEIEAIAERKTSEDGKRQLEATSAPPSWGWVRRMGIRVAIVGVLAIVAPIFGLQVRSLNRLPLDQAYIIGFACLIIGFLMILVGGSDS